MIRIVVVTMTLVLASAVSSQSTDSVKGDDATALCPMHAQHVANMSCPMHAQHAANGDAPHGSKVDARHDMLGVSHNATHHSFRLLIDGGVIELRANAATDSHTIDAIRAHLKDIVSQFSRNDFTTPSFVHGDVPDGVADMARLHDAITYRYEDVPAGARVRIRAKTPDAVSAVHDFMRFQIVEHRTGDSGEIEKNESWHDSHDVTGDRSIRPARK